MSDPEIKTAESLSQAFLSLIALQKRTVAIAEELSSRVEFLEAAVNGLITRVTRLELDRDEWFPRQ